MPTKTMVPYSQKLTFEPAVAPVESVTAPRNSVRPLFTDGLNSNALPLRSTPLATVMVLPPVAGRSQLDGLKPSTPFTSVRPSPPKSMARSWPDGAMPE